MTMEWTPHAATGVAELRCRTAEVVGFDFDHRIAESACTSRAAVNFRWADLAAIVNYLRYHQDATPEPVDRRTLKPDLLAELGDRCGFEPPDSGVLSSLDVRRVFQTVAACEDQ